MVQCSHIFDLFILSVLPLQQRGTNWAPQALKVCLEMGILKRVKIRGCMALGDAKDGALKEISGRCSDIQRNTETLNL